MTRNAALSGVKPIVVFVAACVFGQLQAGNFYFTGEGDGHSWNQKSNWRSGNKTTGSHALPSYADTVIVDPGEGQDLFLSTSNTTESSTWPCHRVYKFMSGTTYIDRKHIFYYHGQVSTDPQIHVEAGATVVLSNSVTAYNGGPMRKTGAGTFVQIGTESAYSSAPAGPTLDIQEGSWLMKCTGNSYGVYCKNTNLVIRSGATFLQEGFNSMDSAVKVTVEENGVFSINSKGGEVIIGTLIGSGTVCGAPGLDSGSTFTMTCDKGPCEFTGIITNVPNVNFAPSSAAKAAGNFRFDAAGDTFRFVTAVKGCGDSIRWVSGVTEAAFQEYQADDDSVVRTENIDGGPVNVTVSKLVLDDSKAIKVTGCGGFALPEIKFADRSTVFTIEDGLVYGGMATDKADSTTVLECPNRTSFAANANAGTVRVKGGELDFYSNSGSGNGGIHRLEVLGGRVVQSSIKPTSFATSADPTTVLIDGGVYLGRSTYAGNDNYQYNNAIFDASDAFRVYIGASGATFGCAYGHHLDSANLTYNSSLRTVPGLEVSGPITFLPQWMSFKVSAPILANGPVSFLGGVVRPGAAAAIGATPDWFGTGTLTLGSTLLLFENYTTSTTLKLAGGVGSQLVYRDASSVCLRNESGKAAQHIVIGAAGAEENSVLRRARKGSVLTLWDPGKNLGEDGYSSVKVNGGVPVDAASGLVKEPVFFSDGTAEHFVTYDAGRGFVQLATTTANLDGGKDSVAVVGSVSVAANTTKEVAAVKVNAWGTLTINAGATLKVGNGTDPAKVILQNSTIAGAGTLDFGTSEGVIMGGAHPNPNTINAKITGSGGITFAATPNYGYRYLNIGGDNTYSGGTWINVARVDVRSNTAFGTGDVWVCGDERNGGRVRFDRPVTIANNFHLSGWGARQNKDGDNAYANGYGTTKAELGALVFPTNGITLTGNIELIGETRIGATKGEKAVDAELCGVISGGAVEAYGIDGRVCFANDNTYSGGTVIRNGQLHIAKSGSLGTGTVTLDTGTLVFDNAEPLVFTNELLGVGKIAMAGSAPVTFATDLTKVTLDSALDIRGAVQPFLGTIPFEVVTSSTGCKATIEFAANLGLVKWGGVTIDYDKMLLTVKSGTTLDLEGATLDVWRLTVEDGAAVINGTVNESHPKGGLMLFVR